jgi:phosphoribosyl-AMP cyclohydrolase
MKKLCLFLTLIFISLSVHAEQIKIWVSDTSEHFIKSDTVKYKGKLVTFWLLTNNNLPDESGHLSYKQKIEIDCNYDQLRMLAQIGYQRAMGSGASTRFRKAYEEWGEIVPESLGGELYRYLCSKKIK